MDHITVIFTKDIWSPISWLIRWALPRSRFSIAQSSHCYIEAGNDGTNDSTLFEASPFNGVDITTFEDVLKSNRVVAVKNYYVADKKLAMSFLIAQLNKKYDYKGAVGMALSPDRIWHEDDSWFCYELAAGAIKAGGGVQFECLSHINETALFAIESF